MNANMTNENSTNNRLSGKHMAQKRHSHPIASQSKKPKRKIAHIADDIIFFEILPKLPVISILRLKTVSKLWYEITSGHFFISRHLEHSRKNPKLLIMPYERKRRALDLYMYDGKQDDNHYARFLFGKRLHNDLDCLDKFPHSKGLVLYSTSRGLSLCNPSTRKSIKLPPGSRHKSRYYDVPFFGVRGGFGFVSLNTDTRPALPSICKVIQYFYRKRSYRKGTFSVGFEVLRVGIDSSWRAVAEDPPYPPYVGHSMCTSRAVYFLINNYLHMSDPQLMFSFDLKNESYSVIPSPPWFSDCGSDMESILQDYTKNYFALHEIDGSVCFSVDDYVEGWRIWKYKEDSSTWILYFRFQYTMRLDRLEIVRAQNGKLLVQYYDEEEKLALCDPQTESYETMVILAEDISYLKRNNVVHHDDVRACFQVYSHVESLVPVTNMFGH